MWIKILSNRAGQIALKSLFGFFILILVGAFSLMILPVLAWTEPTAAPPGNNVYAPVNLGPTYQTKTGSLNVEGNSGANVGLVVGKGDLNVGAGKNVIYGSALNSSVGTLLKLENCTGTSPDICNGAVTALSVDINGNFSTRGSIGISGAVSPENFLVTSGGDITRINRVDYLWPVAQAVGAKCLANNGAGALTWGDCGSGSGTPGGSDTQVQFNDSSSFGGATGLTYNKTNQILTIAAKDAASIVSPLFLNTGASSIGNYISFQLNGTEKGEFGVGDLCGGGSADGTTICSANRIVQFGGAGATDMSVTANKVGIGETSPGYQLDIKNSAATGTAEIRLNQNNAAALWTGLALARQSAEKWYVGMDNAVDATANSLIFRRNGTTNDMTIGTDGTVNMAGQIKIAGGSPGSGKVLTSDTNGLATWQTPAASSGSSPTGSIIMYGAADPPTGWLLCDGTPYPTATYPDLFAIIGYTYGGGGVTFNVPDLQQKFPKGSDGMGGLAVLGATGGSDTHAHTISGTTSSDSAGTPSGTIGSQPGTTAAGAPASIGLKFTGAILLPHGHTISGTADTQNNEPPYVVVNYIIKY